MLDLTQSAFAVDSATLARAFTARAELGPSALGNQIWGRDFSLPPTPNLSEGHSKLGWFVEWLSESTVKNFTLFPHTKKRALRRGLAELRGRERETADYSKHMQRKRWVENIQLNNFNFNGSFRGVRTGWSEEDFTLVFGQLCLPILPFNFYLQPFCRLSYVVRRLSIVFGLLFASHLSHFRISISISMGRDGDGMRVAVNLFTLKFVQHFCPSFQPPQPSSVLRYFARKKERQKETDSKWKKLCQYLFKFITFVDLREKKDKNYRRNLIARHLKAIFVFCVYFSNTFRGFFWGIFWLWALRWVKPQVVSSLVWNRVLNKSSHIC